jgi:hypothetical protein
LIRIGDERPTAGYLVVQLADAPSYRVGLDAGGRTVLLAPHESAGWPPVTLSNLRFQPFVRVQVHDTAGGTEDLEVAVVVIDGQGAAVEPMLPAILAGVIAAAGPVPEPGDLGRAVGALRDVFQALSRAGGSKYLGVWGELLLIANSTNVVQIGDAWGADPTQTFDFASEGSRLEVKTTQQAQRRHHFSFSQLIASRKSDVVVASIQTAAVSDGTSAQELLSESLARLVSAPQTASRVLARATTALGASLLSQDASRYDRVLAEDSLIFLPFSDVPTVTVDPGVIDVSWVAELPGMGSALVADNSLVKAARGAR